MTLAQARRAALTLPEAAEAPHFHYASFRVRGKIFATAPPGGICLHVFLHELDRERALARHPGFIEKLLWGGKVVGVRVALPHADAKAVAELLRQAWSRKAPKGLLGA